MLSLSLFFVVCWCSSAGFLLKEDYLGAKKRDVRDDLTQAQPVQLAGTKTFGSACKCAVDVGSSKGKRSSREKWMAASP